MPEGDDRQRLVVDQGEHVITLLNRYPYNNGHLLVAPRRHVARLDELGEDTQRELSQTLARMVAVLERSMQPQGFNIGLNLGRAAGAGVPGHLHWHIVPRWIGDTNFMPTIAGVHTIPQALEVAVGIADGGIGEVVASGEWRADGISYAMVWHANATVGVSDYAASLTTQRKCLNPEP